MKVKIGPYSKHYSLYSMTRCIEDYIGEEKYDKYFYNTKLYSILSKSFIFKWLNRNGDSRKVSIQIDNYDIWSADHTLAMVIHPVLKKLKESKHGAGTVDDDDVPDELKSTSAPPKKDEFDVDDNFFKRWDYVLDEMIWAFGEIIDDTWEEQYHTGDIDFVHTPVDINGNEVPKDQAKYFRFDNGPNHTHVVDHEGVKKHREKIQNGLRLFAKYYFSLWD